MGYNEKELIKPNPPNLKLDVNRSIDYNAENTSYSGHSMIPEHPPKEKEKANEPSASTVSIKLEDFDAIVTKMRSFITKYSQFRPELKNSNISRTIRQFEGLKGSSQKYVDGQREDRWLNTRKPEEPAQTVTEDDDGPWMEATYEDSSVHMNHLPIRPLFSGSRQDMGFDRNKFRFDHSYN